MERKKEMLNSKLECPFNIPVKLEGPIVNSFCNGEFIVTDDDREFFRLARKLTQPDDAIQSKNSQRKSKKEEV